jgi:hypothetical protein
MSEKGDILAAEEPKYEKKMKVRFLLEKVKVLVTLGRGVSIAVARCHYGFIVN